MGVPVVIFCIMLTTIPEIKKEFFAYRNGIVSDMLRKNGDPHEFIMGCQLVDVVSIASRIEHTVDMANEMWNSTKHRECRMIAPMLYPAELMNEDTAVEWALSVECNEIADVLCHRLFKYLPFSPELAEKLVDNESHLVKYTGWRLFLNLMIMGKELDVARLKALIEKEKVAQPQRDITQLLDSIEEEI